MFILKKKLNVLYTELIKINRLLLTVKFVRNILCLLFYCNILYLILPGPTGYPFGGVGFG